MEPLPAVALVLALLAAITMIGLVWQSRQGRVRAARGDNVVRAADVEASAPFGAHATLLQFSTELCSRCPGTRRLLGEVADARPGVAHIDIDLTHRADLATRFNILQTPTTLILDSDGRVRARVGGAPHRAAVEHQLDQIVQPARLGRNPTPPSSPPSSPVRSRSVHTR